MIDTFYDVAFGNKLHRGRYTLTGNWDTPANWTLASGFPNSSGDTATFPTGNASPITVTVDRIFAVGSLTFSSSTNGYTLTPTASNSLTLGGGAAAPQIAASGTTSNTIAAPLTLAGNIIINQVSFDLTTYSPEKCDVPT